jgi:hypothetical protein
VGESLNPGFGPGDRFRTPRRCVELVSESTDAEEDMARGGAFIFRLRTLVLVEIVSLSLSSNGFTSDGLSADLGGVPLSPSCSSKSS